MASHNMTRGAWTIEENPALRRRMYRFGMSVFIFSQLIPLIVLIDMRYLSAGTYVSPKASPWIGLIAALFMLISLVIAWKVKIGAAHSKDLTPLLKWVTFLGTGALLITFYQWALRFDPTTSRFGEIYYTMTGFAVFYVVVGLIGLLSALSRARFVDPQEDGYWHIEAVSYLWSGIAVIWIITYVVLFLV
ncbi:cytochrome c oxidase subunit 3 [Sulfobacillus thermosulfidooxidans DSM 9293]|uniref:Cytochrome c oxidase subunit 3 n=1 Tax=Sulfobacillus thermosulfidooxidans (strain DSM 9293 / VKM B-1269 / AT-1) TaxID=929705 RepID=A0A1W1WA19_SULTA|nr:hypothetical protein [Sulfobacillus thermosulfidooxidans]SMC03141.1 cytochrome c oxidase subunit 3 [Sulfobacillus thermosulfidooxidans DSM 9293]